MTTEQPRLADTERDEFLGRGGTGVISLSSPGDEPPHAIPVSYGYDPVTETFYFRLAADGDDGKGELAGRAVTFVTYGQVDGRWHSVVAQGHLERTGEADAATESLDALERVTIPYVDIFGDPTGLVYFEFLSLSPDRLTARREG